MAFQGRGIDGAHEFYDLLSSLFSFQYGSHIEAVLVKSTQATVLLSFATSVYLIDLII